MMPEAFRMQRMAIRRNCCSLLLLAACVLSLPTELVQRTAESSTPASVASGTPSDQKNHSNVRKQTVTYILKNGAVQSPAELLSPDRYEFYTFDDDGQIIKKLMSVEEIQRIIANSKNGLPPDTEHIGDYYQVLNVAPDIESHPAVRVNPHEPLFSIHDVITSVQNVLKGEISAKTKQPSSENDSSINKQSSKLEQLIRTESPHLATQSVIETTLVFAKNASSLAMLAKNDSSTKMTTPVSVVKVVTDVTPTSESTLSSMQFKTSVAPVTKITTKVVTTTSHAKTTVPVKGQNSKPTNSATTKETVKVTTTKTTVDVSKKPTVVISKKPSVITKKPIPDVPKKTTNAIEKATSTSTVRPPTLSTTQSTTQSGLSTKIEVLKVTSTVSQSNSLSSQVPVVTTDKAATDSTTAAVATVSTPNVTSFHSTEKPASTDKPMIIEQKNNVIETPSVDISEERTAPLSLADAHPAYTSNDTYLNVPALPESVFAIENLLFDSVTSNKNSSKGDHPTNFTGAESALSEVQLPMNQDLAESVSSVLSQIANEIAVNNQLNLNDLTTTEASPTDTTEAIITTTEPFNPTIVPDSDIKSVDKIDDSTETTTSMDSVLEVTTFSAIPITFKPQNKPMPFSKVVAQQGVATTEPEGETTTAEPVESRTDTNDILVTESTTLSADNDNIEPTTLRELLLSTIATSAAAELEKKNDAYSRVEVIENNSNVNSSIEIIQEAETGRIPRPTQRPEEISTRPGTDKIVAEDSSSNQTNISNIVASTPINSSTNNITSTITPDSVEDTTEQEVTESDNGINEFSSNESHPSDSVENISLSFVPMVIRSSTTETAIIEAAAETTPKFVVDNSLTSEKLKLPPTDETIESKIVSDENADVSSMIDRPPQKLILASSDDEKEIPSVNRVPNEPPIGSTKQNHGKPQNNVKVQKPVFIKPTKTKPQLSDAKPSKPTRPLSSEEEQRPYETPLMSSPSALELDQAPAENLGLEATTVHLEPDVREFVDLCNELAFSLWASITHNGLSFVRSVLISPFAVTSLLAMVFLGARGPTSGQMNDILKLDDVVTFNPHLVFRNVTESLVIARNPGVATAAFVRELYSDRSKGKLLDFYKERAQQFYDGHVEEVNFKAIGETLRRQTNHLVKRQTWGKVKDFLQGSTLMLRPPLAAFSANIFQADCSRASMKDRDGEMYFVVLPSSRLRRLVPVPAAVWRDDFLAGYEPNLDATVAAIGAPGGIVSTIFVMPGQQGLIAPGDSLARLEHHLLGSSFKRGHWTRLMRSLLRRPGLELQVPRLSHKSVVNATASLQKMGLKDLFSAERADLTGLNGLANDLHLSDMVQVNMFSTCGDESGGHHSEYYPATPLQRKDKSADNVFAESIESLFAVSDFDDPSISALPLELRPRQARIPSGRIEGRSPDPPRLRLDRPFLFFVRHNPTGIILHVGRFNPRLMH